VGQLIEGTYNIRDEAAMKHAPNFLIDATQTAYLWSCRGYYGQRSGAVQALLKRKSAKGKIMEEGEKALEVGLRVIARTRESVSRIPSPELLPIDEARRVSAGIALEVRRAVPESTAEMVDYAIGMFFWMPIMR
jgi:hypothetical protein